MMTSFDLNAGANCQIQHIGADSQAMTSYKLFSHSQPLGVRPFK